MGSASRAALEVAKSALASAKGVTRGTGEQLLSAGRDIAGSTQLRALLADPSVPVAEKTGLIGGIFSSLDPAAAVLELRRDGELHVSCSFPDQHLEQVLDAAQDVHGLRVETNPVRLEA